MGRGTLGWSIGIRDGHFGWMHETQFRIEVYLELKICTFVGVV